MRVAVIGGGGREHAIIKKLKESSEIKTIYALPGNGGIAADAVTVPIGAKDIAGITDFAKANNIDYAVVSPDDPLCLGAVDALNEAGIPAFGPDKKAAAIEGSKIFAKEMMRKYGIPTAGFSVFTDMNEALEYVKSVPMPAVVKADGLALGKGVIIAQTVAEAENAVRSMMENKIFGESGSRIVIEEYLTGPEVSVLSFTDGRTVVPMISSMDHKRAFDGDKGPNTGGMGTVAPNPYYTPEIARECMDTIFLPTVKAMNAEGRKFKGCLYFGLMLTEKGPKVIEYNCRFGDPEAQVVLPLLKTDLFEIMRAVTDERLSDINIEWSTGSACCVVMASKGYPKSYETGYPIEIPKDLKADVTVAGAKLENGRLVTSGGRVLGVTAVGDTLPLAVETAYAAAGRIRFENAVYRRDIGTRALMRTGEK